MTDALVANQITMLAIAIVQPIRGRVRESFMQRPDGFAV